MMKEENRKTGGKCEMYFIKEEDRKFIAFEQHLSLKKLQKRVSSKDVTEDTPTVAINKDILARISLAMSTSYKVKVKPRIAIVDNVKYPYLADYVSVDDSMQIVEHPKGTLDDKYYEHEAHDGCGIMSPSFANTLSNELGLDYTMSWCGIRLYGGIACKGLLTRIDFVEYFREYADSYTIKDIYGTDHDVRNLDCIINTSMAKWAKNFSSMQEIETLISEVDDKYREDMQYIYVTKYNKKAPKKYTLSNYQLMSNLALRLKDFKEVGKLTEEIYQKVCNKDLDTVKLLLGEVANEDELENLEYEEVDLGDDEDNSEDVFDINVSTKAQALLNLDSDFKNLYIVDNCIRKLVDRKIRQLASGKMYLKGNYKVACADPIAFLNYLINGELHNENTLKEHQFFIPNMANKKLVISRNPLNSFSEVQRIEAVTNEVYEKYLGALTEEILVFNQVDDTGICQMCCRMSYNIHSC